MAVLFGQVVGIPQQRRAVQHDRNHKINVALDNNCHPVAKEAENVRVVEKSGEDPRRHHAPEKGPERAADLRDKADSVVRVPVLCPSVSGLHIVCFFLSFGLDH